MKRTHSLTLQDGRIVQGFFKKEGLNTRQIVESMKTVMRRKDGTYVM